MNCRQPQLLTSYQVLCSGSLSVKTQLSADHGRGLPWGWQWCGYQKAQPKLVWARRGALEWPWHGQPWKKRMLGENRCQKSEILQVAARQVKSGGPCLIILPCGGCNAPWGILRLSTNRTTSKQLRTRQEKRDMILITGGAGKLRHPPPRLAFSTGKQSPACMGRG